MNTKKTLTLMVLALTTSMTVGGAAQGQYSISGEQPAVGSLHVKEAKLEAALTKNYKAGLIDPFELANLTRDLDAIRVKEESYRMRKQGMSQGAFARVARKLDAFQSDLEQRCAEKVNPYNVASR